MQIFRYFLHEEGDRQILANGHFLQFMSAVISTEISDEDLKVNYNVYRPLTLLTKQGTKP
jgi:hypothetical protein